MSNDQFTAFHACQNEKHHHVLTCEVFLNVLIEQRYLSVNFTNPLTSNDLLLLLDFTVHQ